MTPDARVEIRANLEEAGIDNYNEMKDSGSRHKQSDREAPNEKGRINVNHAPHRQHLSSTCPGGKYGLWLYHGFGSPS